MIDLHEYEQLALETGAFLDIELEIQKEALKTWEEKPGQSYFLVEIRDGKLLAGYCLYHRSPNTEFTLDIHSFVVGRDYRGKGVGTRLLDMVEEELAVTMGSAILRIEISRKKEWIIERDFFISNGFEMIGHIPDFYETDNDYYIYAKHIRRVDASRSPGSPEPGSGEPGREPVPIPDGGGAVPPDSVAQAT
ncbi:MAG: GNAT family N-acetyltransferase [Spirochaetes bacterium]|nr:GNAT family N-acetyltransferase [Spirochaetota bacterium]